MVLLLPTFNLPPIDGSISPALAIDFHLKHNPDCLFATLHDVDNSTQTKITYKQLAHAVHRTAYLFNPNAAIPQGTNVGIIASTDTIVYITIFLGIMRAGLVPFPISPRIPVEGISHLLAATETSYLIIGGSPVIDELRMALGSTLHSYHRQRPISFVNLPTFNDIFFDDRTPENHATKRDKYAFPSITLVPKDAPVCILHSSGSTGMPKVVVFHLEGVFKNYVIRPVPQMLAAPETKLGTMALPTFHSMGTMMQVFAPLYAGYTQALFAPHHPPVVPTSNLTLKAATSLGCDYLICAPAFLESWAQDEDAISRLSKLKCAMFGGGSLAEAVGNKLVSRGVRLLPMYGATELGTVVELDYSEKDPYDWPYVKFVPRIAIHLDPQHDESETYELVYMESDGHKPFVYNSRIDGRSAYKSKDLVVRHPTNPGLFKLVGRLDDQIALSNGEKCNPLPMEVEIVNSPHVHAAVVFGREKNQTGVIIELAGYLKERYRDGQSQAKLVEELWPYIENANRMAPTHARLSRGAVLLTDPTRPFPRTPKGTVSRAAVLTLCADEIEGMYAKLETHTDVADGIEVVQSWNDPASIEMWIGGCVSDILGRKIDPNQDLFQQGMDSLTSTMLLQTLRGILYASSQDAVQSAAKQLHQQTIFEKPTVSQLTAHLVQLCSAGSTLVDSQAKALEAIQSMVKKYDSDWPVNTSEEPRVPQPAAKERVVVTGTSGGLGSYLLSQLLQNDRVEKAWALNRKSSKDSATRQRESFEDKLLDIQLLESERITLLDANLEDDKLGLSGEVYAEIRSQATVIIHNAWQVNFNLSLQSFEPSVHGARNLLNLALNSTSLIGGPRFLFMSSVSVAGFNSHADRLAETYIKPEEAVDASLIGYGQSKLVTEQLLKSTRERGLEACIVRLGQLTGDSMSGAWSLSDWVPAVLASSVSANCLPAINGTVSWLPLDIAARSILDASLSRSGILPPVIQISHPRPVPWRSIMVLFSKAITSHPRAKTSESLPIVQFGEWNQRVCKSAASFHGPEEERYRYFPSQKIRSTIDDLVRADERSEDAGDREAGGVRRLDTREAEQFSDALRNADELGEVHMQKWVKYWESKGLFARPNPSS